MSTPPRPPIRGLVLRGQRPPASRCRTVFLEVGQVTHRTIVNSGWRAARRDQEARRNEAAARNSPGNGQGDIATPGGSRSGQQEHQDATGQPPGQVPPQGGAMVDAVLHSLNRDDGPGSARGNAGTRPLASVGGGDLLCHAPHLMRTGSVTRLRPRQRSRPGLQTRASSTQTCPLVIERVRRERVGSPAAGIRS